MSEEASLQAPGVGEPRTPSPSHSAETYQLLYSKSRVTLHPTPYAKDNVPGYLAILKRRIQSHPSSSNASLPPPGIDNRTSIVLSWLPEDLVKDRSETAKFVDVELREAEGPGERGEEDLESFVRDEHSGKVLRMRELIEDESMLVQPPPLAPSSSEPNSPRSSASYAFSQPLGTIYAVHMAPPTISNWYGSMTLSLVGGDTLPPLYFHDDESRSTILGMIRASKGVPAASAPTSTSSSPSPASSYKQSSSASSSSHIPPAGVPGTTYPPMAPAGVGNGGGTPPIWGGDELIHHLRKYAFVHRSVHDHRVFLVNPTPADLEFHSTPVFADDAVDGISNRPERNGAGPGHGDSSFAGSSSGSHSDIAFPDDPFAPTYPSAAMRHGQRHHHAPGEPPGTDAFTSWARTTRLSLLSSFSHVTRSARDASRQILSHPAGRPYTSRLPAAVQSFAHAGPLGPFGPSSVPASPEDVKKLSQKAGVIEYDSARVYLAKWARLVAEEGERNKRREEEEAARRSKTGSASMTPSSSASRSGVKTEVGGLGVFEVLDLEAFPEDSPTSSRRRRRYRGITLEEWESWFDPEADGRPRISFTEMKARVFERGLAPETRRSAWPLLLGVVPWYASADARAQDWAAKRQEYYKLKSLWAGPTAVARNERPDQGQSPESMSSEDEAAALRERDDVVEQRHRIRVDCLRTDRKHPMFRQVPEEEEAGGSGEPTTERSPEGSVLLSGRIQDRQAGQRTTANNHVMTLGEILLTFTFYDTLSGSDTSGDASNGSPAEKREVMRIDQSELGGYVQGMSDLCAPLYITCDADEVEAFWCFFGFMKRMRPNFLSSQQGMKTQLLQLQALIRRADPELYAHLEMTDSLHLFFCFRWLLVRFKREFGLEEVCRIWEACWAIEPSADDARDGTQEDQKAPEAKDSASQHAHTSYFHLFVCLSILVSHRGPTLAYLHCFDEVLQYFQGLAAGGQMDVERVIQGAEALFLEMRRRASEAEPDATSSKKTAKEPDSGAPESDAMMRELLGLDSPQG